MIFLCLAFGSTCPSPARAEHLPIRIYTSADGLGSSFVDYLMRDSRGFMWFCTRDGLSRFDGARFITYRLGGELAPPGIEDIYETRDGFYWIDTTGGLYRFRADAVARPDERDEGRSTLDADFVSDRRGVLHEDGAGNLWFASEDKLLRVTEVEGRVVFQPVELGLPAQYTGGFIFLSACESGDGSLWLGSTRGLLRRLPDARLVFYAFDAVNDGNVSILFDDAGRGWLARENDLFLLKPEPPSYFAGGPPLTVRPFGPGEVVTPDAAALRMPERPGGLIRFRNENVLAGQRVRRLYKTSDGHVWITSDEDLLEFDGRALRRYTGAQGLLPGMGRMAEDAAGNLWIGGEVGLMRLDPHGLVTYGVADGLKAARLISINEASDGALYFSTLDYSISRFDGAASFRTVRPRIPPVSRAIWASRQTFLSSTGEWWLLTRDKLYRFAPVKNFMELGRCRPAAAYDHRDGPKSEFMFQMFEDSAGGVWLSTHTTNHKGDGLSRWDRAADRFVTYSEAEGFPDGKAASSFAEDRAGDLWFDFYEGGVARYRDGRFTAFGEADGAPASFVTALHVDHAGRLWLASSVGGVSRVDDPEATRPRFVSYTTKDGLASNNVRAITEDLYGNIYLGTARGVDRVSPDGARVKHYSVSDGLASDFVVAARRDRSGALWFATTNGLSKLLPTAGEQARQPPVWLGGLRVAGNARPVPALGDSELRGLELAPSDNNLQIDFFGLDFRAGETLRYQFILEGANSTWSAPTEQWTVTYADLQPGTYRFMVRAVTPDGLRSPAPAVVSFTILRPFWQRWWFVTLALLLCGAAAYTLYRYRLARLLELERVRTRIATDLHDDIGASMSQIAILSEVAGTRLGDEGSQLRELLATIAGTSREAVDAMSDIVWAVNPQRDHLSDLTQRMRRFAGDSMNARDIELSFCGFEGDKDYRLGADVRREVYLIFKETINNVSRHSGCAAAEVEFRVDAGWLVVRVSDDGAGFDYLDCVVIGYNELPFERYESFLHTYGEDSEAYRDLKFSFVNLGGKKLDYTGLLNYARQQSRPPDNQPPTSAEFKSGDIPNLAAVYLTKFLRNRGYRAGYINLFQYEKEKLAECLAADPLCIVITTTFYVVNLPVHEMVEFIRAHNPGVKIIVGGPLIANYTRNNQGDSFSAALADLGADIYVIEGQGEATLARIVECLKNDESLSGVPNIAYLERGKLQRTALVPENNSLDENYIDWHAFRAEKTGATIQTRTARSCAFKCSFCNYPTRAGALTLTSLDVLERELDSMRELGSVRNLVFIDDTFNVPFPRFKDICRLMIRKNYHFDWFSYFRCSNSDEEAIELMAESGCKGVFLGIESGSPTILANMNKSATVEKYAKGIEMLRRHDILTFALSSSGFPERPTRRSRKLPTSSGRQSPITIARRCGIANPERRFSKSDSGMISTAKGSSGAMQRWIVSKRWITSTGCFSPSTSLSGCRNGHLISGLSCTCSAGASRLSSSENMSQAQKLMSLEIASVSEREKNRMQQEHLHNIIAFARNWKYVS